MDQDTTCSRSFPGSAVVRIHLPQETLVQSLGREDPLEKEIATRSSILAWRIPWTEEPGGLQSVGLQMVRHEWATNTTTIKISPEFYLLIPLTLNWTLVWKECSFPCIFSNFVKKSKSVSLQCIIGKKHTKMKYFIYTYMSNGITLLYTQN